jgi:hypothetical protein
MTRCILVSRGGTVLSPGELSPVYDLGHFLARLAYGDSGLRELVNLTCAHATDDVFVLELGPGAGVSDLTAWVTANDAREDAFLASTTWEPKPDDRETLGSILNKKRI